MNRLQLLQFQLETNLINRKKLVDKSNYWNHYTNKIRRLRIKINQEKQKERISGPD